MDITAKLWSYCHILRHDGVDYADYIEQLTYLLFLKMADENLIDVPKVCRWENLLLRSGEDLKSYYEFILQKLKNEPGILGQIFIEPISKIQNPVSLKKIIDGIESVGWTKLDKDVKGEAFEGLLEKTANEGKKGAGQFFTPRPLIQAIVDVMKPNPLETKNFRIADVACGTAGFITMAIDWAKSNISKSEWKSVKDSCYYGTELVTRPYRLALMNLFLHGVKPNLSLKDSIYSDSEGSGTIDCILTNPPFGSRGSSGPPFHRNFVVKTSNIQLNFIQHVLEMLKENGRAAIVLPDSALSDNKSKEVWENLIGRNVCNVHTILKLPLGTFTPYANGVKACVVFLQKGYKTKNVWVYDSRSQFEDVTKSSRPLNYSKHFQDFVKCYGKDPNGNSKRFESNNFEKYSIKEIKEKYYDLSFGKVKLPLELKQPSYYIDDLIQNIEHQLTDLKLLKLMLDKKD